MLINPFPTTRNASFKIDTRVKTSFLFLKIVEIVCMLTIVLLYPQYEIMMIFAIKRKDNPPKIVVVMQLKTVASSVFVRCSNNVIPRDKGTDIAAAIVNRSNLPAKEVFFRIEMNWRIKHTSKTADVKTVR